MTGYARLGRSRGGTVLGGLQRVAIAFTAGLFLSGCDYGPDVPGGRPTLAYEANPQYGRGLHFAQTHFYEVSPENLRHPEQLKAYFHWRCRETYLPVRCAIFVWRKGEAPHHGALFSHSEIAKEVALYQLDKGSGEEHFDLNPAQQLFYWGEEKRPDLR